MKGIVHLTLLVGLVCCGPFLPSARCAQTSPNFVVILTDDQSWVGTSVRMDPDIPHTRSDYYQTPHIERLAAMGMRFVQGYAPAPYCCPTRRSLLIGQTPARHIYQKDQENWPKQYRKQLTLPRMLKKANPHYKTAHFGKWDMRFDEITPAETGYDVSDGYTGNGIGGGRGSGGPAARDDPKLIFGITERACDFIETQKNSGRPFYLQVSHYAVHLDIYYRAKTLEQTQDWPKGQKHTMPQFAAMTSDVDTGIGLLLDKIKALGLMDTTYIFFLSDNGGRLTMPGQKDDTRPRNDPLYEGKGSMYEGGLRVPFIVIGPNIKPGSVSRTPVTGLDIFPTIAALARYPDPLPEVLDGGSMTEVLFNQGTGSVRRNRPFLLFHQAVQRSGETALIHGNYKLVKSWADDKLELFNLSKSVREQKNLVDKLPGKTADMHRMMVDFITEVKAETRRTESKRRRPSRTTTSASKS